MSRKWNSVNKDAEIEKLRIANILVRSVAFGFSVQEKCLLNHDLKALDKIYSALANNVVKHGKPYCPCRIIVPGEPNLHNVCPCSSAHEEILTHGHCKCRLFFANIDAGDVKN